MRLNLTGGEERLRTPETGADLIKYRGIVMDALVGAFLGILAIGLVLIVIPLTFWISTYNNLVALRQNVEESWSAVETELRRRYDLIPNLVETVKGYAMHEKDTLEAVIQARNSGIKALGSPQKAELATKDFSQALGRLLSITEAYPQLQANDNFKSLQKELADTETNLSRARRFYNANVKDLNTVVEMFPSNIVANHSGFTKKVYFGIDNPDAFEAPKLSFSSTPESDAVKIKLKETEKTE